VRLMELPNPALERTRRQRGWLPTVVTDCSVAPVICGGGVPLNASVGPTAFGTIGSMRGIERQIGQ
jgi:hypothetical protein